MAKEKAIIKNCPMHEDASIEVDNCLFCAPFWYRIPICPKHKKKLTYSGYCRDCKKYYDISEAKK